MAQLHKLLAVVAGLKGAAMKIMTETRSVFHSKGHLFDGRLKTYKPDAEDGDTIPEERTPLVSTVGEKLSHLPLIRIRCRALLMCCNRFVVMRITWACS